ncbi:hypothetical protein [Pusillimonas sp.]|uniref:hypothetical protein n=1 Tax=Pusillimonas sp. TaxID=3040095 RepID=UPI0037CCAE8F
MTGLLTRVTMGLASECIRIQAHRIQVLEQELEQALEQADEYLEQLKYAMAANKRKRAQLRLLQDKQEWEKVYDVQEG